MRKSVFILVLAIVMLATGCGNKSADALQVSPPDHHIELDDYISSVREQSDTIQSSLANDPLTQTDMNLKSQELYVLWDSALNVLWDEMKLSLPDEEFKRLLEQQRIWISEKEQSAAAAGKDVEGGSLYPLVVTMEAAKITEERVYTLYEMLTQPEIH